MSERKKRIVFMGSRPLGRRVLQFLLDQPDVDIIGMIVQPSDTGRYWKEDPCDLNVRILRDDKDMTAMDFDLGISVNYWKLIREPVLSHPLLGFVNVHHSHNLRLRGRNCTTLAILRAREDNIWHHGSTLHYVSDQLDAGKIIASRACRIHDEDTAFTLFHRVEDTSFEMLKEWLPRIWRERIIPYDAPSEFHLWKRSAIDDKEVSLDKSPLDIYDRVRAFVFPPFELPYAFVDGRKRHLTVLRGDETNLLVDAGQGRCVYWAE